MFDLITGQARHLPRTPMVPLVVSTTSQVAALAFLFVGSVVWVSDRIPEVPTMMAFVAALPEPPAPPPPPAPVPQRSTPAASVPAPASRFAAPIDAPPAIVPEPAEGEDVNEGVPGGVEGGVPGGVIGGVVGGVVDAAPPPPPPPPPPKPSVVRVGGQIQAPALVRRVEPMYPQIAIDASLQGVVILEATVDQDGRVANVVVLRSVNPLLDREAIAAVRQWQYTPLLLNGHRTGFVVTVTLSFHLEDPRGGKARHAPGGVS